MHAHEVWDLFRFQEGLSPENALRKAWLSTHGPCKDVLALAFMLKPIPHNLDTFRQKIALSPKPQDWLIASFHLIYVGKADGKEWGWNKAPYDKQKTLRDVLKPLYTLDKSGPDIDQTRFWSYKKVSNNMNKGPRIDEPVDGNDLSFVLPAGVSFNTFLREDNYEVGKCLFEEGWAQGDEEGMIDAFQPVILQLSGANGEQSAKGNGLKVRRVVPVAREILSSFCNCFFSNSSDLNSVQEKAGELVPLKSVAKSQRCFPLVCHVNERAFLHREKDTGIIEIVDSGLDQELGRCLIVSDKILLTAMHSENVERAMRMLSVAIGQKAVKCIFANEQDRAKGSSDTCVVVYLQVDFQKTMLFNVLHSSRNEESSISLPKNECLTMCFGRGIQQKHWDGDEEQPFSFLQWYAPNVLVPVVEKDGNEVLCHVVYEMEVSLVQLAGQREEKNKLLFMDEVGGFHHLVKVFYSKKVSYKECTGLECSSPQFVITWQLRSGMSTSSTYSLQGQSKQRKRVSFEADELDHINVGLKKSSLGSFQEKVDDSVGLETDSVGLETDSTFKRPSTPTPKKQKV
jgi:hypothetical protein